MWTMRRPRLPTSLSGRVTFTAVAVLAVLLIILFVVVDLVLSQRLHSDVRTRLTDRVVLARQLSPDLSSQQLVRRLRGDGVTVQLCAPASGGQSTSNDCVVADPAPLPPDTGQPPGGGRVGRGSRHRPGVRRLPPPAPVRTNGSVSFVRTTLADGFVLTLSVDTGQITSALRRLIILEAIGGVVALLLAALLLWRLSRIALRPLDDMTALARRIAAGDRGRRLSMARTDTELGRTAAAFDAMLDELEAAVAAAQAAEVRLRDFLGDASHELRTPLAGIQATGENLLRENPDRAERERLAVAMIRQTRRASRLVDELLAVARLDSAELPPGSPVDLRAVAADELERIRLVDPHRTYTLDGGGATVNADAHRLAQVIGNLLDNARHATAPDGLVAVVVSTADDTVRVTVTDDGPGVPPADAERIFDRFVRLDTSRTRAVEDSGGAGLGLAIARGLTRAYGGDLRCHPRDDGASGARFLLEFPAPILTTR